MRDQKTIEEIKKELLDNNHLLSQDTPCYESITPSFPIPPSYNGQQIRGTI